MACRAVYNDQKRQVDAMCDLVRFDLLGYTMEDLRQISESIGFCPDKSLKHGPLCKRLADEIVITDLRLDIRESLDACRDSLFDLQSSKTLKKFGNRPSAAKIKYLEQILQASLWLVDQSLHFHTVGRTRRKLVELRATVETSCKRFTEIFKKILKEPRKTRRGWFGRRR